MRTALNRGNSLIIREKTGNFLISTQSQPPEWRKIPSSSVTFKQILYESEQGISKNGAGKLKDRIRQLGQRPWAALSAA
jgi:hypothetical protein